MVADMENKRKIIDRGHYEDIPIVRSARTVEVAAGETFDKVYILSGKRISSEALPAESEAVSVCTELPFDNIIAGEGSKVNLVLLILPGVSAEVSIPIDIVGQHAEVNFSGLYVCGSDEKLSVRTEVRHRVPSCSSYQIFNGIASGRADVKFYGKIIVAPDAQKTEAYQTNRNIILSDEANAETKPQLEIYADDVKCSHGATIGRLNEDEQFYMRSRGIPEDEAKVLQMISFIAPVLAAVGDEAVRTSLNTLIENAVRGL